MLHITPDQLSAAGGYIARTWGDHGYTVEEITSPSWLVSLFHVRMTDGSRFVVACDRWGNCRDAGDSHGYAEPERDARLAAVVAEMTEAARLPDGRWGV